MITDYIKRQREVIEGATEFDHEIKPFETKLGIDGESVIYYVSPHAYFNESDADADAKFIKTARTEFPKTLDALEIALEALEKSNYHWIEGKQMHDVSNERADCVLKTTTKALEKIRSTLEG